MICSLDIEMMRIGKEGMVGCRMVLRKVRNSKPENGYYLALDRLFI